MQTQQTQFWQGDFGAEYTQRNSFTVDEQNAVYRTTYGISRTEMNRLCLDGISLSNILEIGCNVGNQLRCLQSMGYNQLYGIELQELAVEQAKQLSKGINILQGSAFDLPFKNSYFDLAFTSGVLIHISPQDVHLAMDEIYRVSKKYIWGFEYFADQLREIDYRGNGDKMWKTNFMQLYLDRYSDLRVVSEKKFKYLENNNENQMFLLEKAN